MININKHVWQICNHSNNYNASSQCHASMKVEKRPGPAQLALKNFPLYIKLIYHIIVGNFGKVFNLVNWRFCGKSLNLKPTNIISYTIALYGSTHDHQIKNSPMHSDDWFAKLFNAHQSFPLYSNIVIDLHVQYCTITL